MSETTPTENDVPSGQWIAIADGFLYDPFLDGHVEVRDGVAYWTSGDSEWALDLSDAAVAEAFRRNRQSRVIPPAQSAPVSSQAREETEA